MKVFVLLDWEKQQVIGVYLNHRSAEDDRYRLKSEYNGLAIIERDLIKE
jgi:hypothetical protein